MLIIHVIQTKYLWIQKRRLVRKKANPTRSKTEKILRQLMSKCNKWLLNSVLNIEIQIAYLLHLSYQISNPNKEPVLISMKSLFWFSKISGKIMNIQKQNFPNWRQFWHVHQIFWTFCSNKLIWQKPKFTWNTWNSRTSIQLDTLVPMFWEIYVLMSWQKRTAIISWTQFSNCTVKGREVGE